LTCLGCGELSYAKVRALTRVATPETEARLLAVGRAGTAAHVERLVRGWRSVDRRAEARETVLRHAGRALHVRTDEDGMVVVSGRLEPEVGALLAQALAAARETLYQRARAREAAAANPGDVSAETPSLAQQQADALALLAESALHHLDPGAPGERYWTRRRTWHAGLSAWATSRPAAGHPADPSLRRVGAIFAREKGGTLRPQRLAPRV
jgi:hypothetical protein